MSVSTHNGSVRHGICAGVAAMTVTCAAAAPAAPATVTGIPMAAVWREQHVDFFYKGRTSRYSCDGLRDKVRAMLLDLGARRDLKITAIGCYGPGRLPVNSQSPSLDVTFSA